MSVTLRQLAQNLGIEFSGDPELCIHAVSSLPSAKEGSLCFINNKKYIEALASSLCSAVIVPVGLACDAIVEKSPRKAILRSDNPQLHFVATIKFLAAQNEIPSKGEIHPSAQVSELATVSEKVNIGALCVIEANAFVGENTTIAAGCVIGRDSKIGNDCKIHRNVTIGDDVIIGDRCDIQAGAVIGAEGFGLVSHEQRWVKIPHLGTVIIEDDVDIGANTTVDRGALDNTVIETGCKLDNQIQVAHNVRIGAHTAIAACVGIAGSAIIGRHCKISGAAVVLGHLTIADHVTITAMSLVTKSIKQAGVYSSGTPLLENSQWHKSNVRYKSLDKLARMVADLARKNT
ncbi:MAG: UDP-3-O-[3-hydroxymyristoyl] glucosamine N-acyltransferase [Planctomycetota bacterium]|jgi:UDP-3-O-[3-hydroxymyristoyl] glucosamine N-acyltransferase